MHPLSSPLPSYNTEFPLQQGVRFDPDLPQTIRLEFAKSNTKVSKPKQQQNPNGALNIPVSSASSAAAAAAAAAAAVAQQPLVHPLTGRKYLARLGGGGRTERRRTNLF